MAASGGTGASGVGGTGAAGAGAAGSAGSSGGAGAPAIDCPLGTVDADGNGYPDACEKILWSVSYQVTDFTQVNVYYTPGVPVFLVLLAGLDGAPFCPAGPLSVSGTTTRCSA
jgi:hypothetical protein